MLSFGYYYYYNYVVFIQVIYFAKVRFVCVIQNPVHCKLEK